MPVGLVRQNPARQSVTLTTLAVSHVALSFIERLWGQNRWKPTEKIPDVGIIAIAGFVLYKTFPFPKVQHALVVQQEHSCLPGYSKPDGR